ncbi:response regulator [Chitinophaga arvensicola]|nr:response regulator [Chitinophaga arvensicola]
MNRKILITENDVDIKMLLSSLLRRHYDVSFLEDADILLQGQFETPDLFVLSTHLSDVDVSKVCQYLKTNKATKDIPILIIAGSQDLDFIRHACPGDDFIMKPFSGPELLARVHIAIDQKISR